MLLPALSPLHKFDTKFDQTWFFSSLLSQSLNNLQAQFQVGQANDSFNLLLMLINNDILLILLLPKL